MSKENVLLILWIIFGFVFIEAFDSVLVFFTHLTYFGLTASGVSFKIQTFIIPILTLILYVISTVLILKKIKTSSGSDGIYLADFPKKTFTILVIIAIFLSPITNKLSGLFAENSDAIQNSDAVDFISFYGWMTLGINMSKWIIMVALIFMFRNKYNLKDKIN
ncbi:hypothetical protein ALE3EI_1602 [Constantimarinum furrinae]|uniref:Uncharacterized protein n=1 Tax=Constantimarinum furrinae TaxID=2562285 RepID=A0A7G8PUZ2_9FLAO|nr:hypothetical protein ALE3EI_1602 [Constantimarinum furrinae]